MTFVLNRRAVSSAKSNRSTTFRFRKKSVGLGPDSSAREGGGGNLFLLNPFFLLFFASEAEFFLVLD